MFSTSSSSKNAAIPISKNIPSKLFQRALLSFALISFFVVYLIWNRLSNSAVAITSLKPTTKQASLFPLGKEWPVNSLSPELFDKHIGIPLDRVANTNGKKYGVFVLITTTNPLFKCSNCKY